jgi:translation initiation factor IF-1
MGKNKDDIIEVDGTITEMLPNQFFRVELDNEHLVTAYTSGKIKKFKIRLVEGDRVKIELSVYDMTKGRITYRY